MQGQRTGLEPAHVEEVVDQTAEFGQALLGGGQEFLAVLGGEVDVAAAQRADGSPAAGQRCPQVVADRGEECGAHAVGRLDRFDLGRGLGEPGAFDGRGQMRREGREDTVLGSGQPASAQHQDAVVPDRDPGLVIVRRVRQRAAHGTGIGVPAARPQCDAVHAEGLAGPFQEDRYGPVLAQDAAGQRGEGFRFRGRPCGPPAQPQRAVDDGGDGDGDRRQGGLGDDDIGSGEAEVADGRNEVVVQQQRGRHRGEQRGDHPADTGHSQHGEQEEQCLAGEVECQRAGDGAQ